MKPKLKPPGSKRLKLRCVVPLAKFAFKFNLRRYSVGCVPVVRRCRLTLSRIVFESAYGVSA